MGLAVVLLLFVAAPYILASSPVRNLLLRLAVSKIDGRITCGQARLGWFSAPAFYDIAIAPPSGPPLLSIAKIEMDRSLWQLISGWPDCGRVVCERPVAHLIVDDTGSNFRRVFAPLEKDEPEPDEPVHERPWTGVPQVRAEIEIANASVIVERVAGNGATVAEAIQNAPVVTATPRITLASTGPTPQPAPAAESADDGARWEAQGIHVVAGLRPLTDGEGLEAYVEPGKLIENAEITRAVANQWLQFVAPILAGSANVDGDFSVELAEWRIPLEHPDQAVCGGHLVIHSLVVEAGPMVTYIASLVGVPAELLMARDTGIEFLLQDRRVHHRDLGFRLGGLPVHTSGSVGLDRTLDLLAEVTLPTFAESTGPLRRALSGKTIEIPVHGTLAKPEVDGQALAHSGMGILDEAFGGLLDRLTGESGPAFPELHNPNEAIAGDEPAAPTPTDSDAAEDAPAAPGDSTAPGDEPVANDTSTSDASPGQVAGDAAAVAMPIVEELLKAWRTRRQQSSATPAGDTEPAPGDVNAATADAPATDTEAPTTETAPRRPLLDTWRRLRERRRRAAEEPAPAIEQPSHADE